MIEGNGNLYTALGVGNGTFGVLHAGLSTGVDSSQDVEAADLNGDGLADLIATDYTSPFNMAVNIGLGDGTFAAPVLYSLGAGTGYGIHTADLNRDGAIDIVANGYNDDIRLFFGNTAFRAGLVEIDLRTRAGALMTLDAMTSTGAALSRNVGLLGAARSRLAVQIANLGTRRNSYEAAAARIMDADIATESATVLQRQILQNFSASLLAQANTEPKLALSLLQGIDR